MGWGAEQILPKVSVRLLRRRPWASLTKWNKAD